MTEVAPILASAHALLVHLRRSPLFEITLPSKTQAYMFMGKPVVMAVPGDAAALVAEAGAGICAESENPASLADAVWRLAQLPAAERARMGARARRFYDAQLSLTIGTGRMIAAFEQVRRGRRPRVQAAS
jgi:glycosyltransferase involved in cell wall biosynthesis